jgi:acyl-CoA synthetase (AMP-forming)/AMP-acid ligase II
VADADILAGHAASKPHKPAVIFKDRIIDFATLNDRANRAANMFLSLGCVNDDRVAVMSYNSATGFEITSGLRKAGLVLTAINYRLRGPEVAYVINDSGARVVVAGPDHVDVVEAARAEVARDVTYIAVGDRRLDGWLGFEDLMKRASNLAPDTEQEPGLLKSMVYTSGTTGHPKGAWRPKGINLENVLQVIMIFGLAEDDVHLMCGPGYHSAVGFFAALHGLLGSTVVVEPKFEADEALDLIERHRVTTTFMAPTLLQRLLDAQERRPRDLSSLRAVILGAAPCPFPLKERAEAILGQKVWEFYGATETGINTVLRPEDQLRKPGSCGTAVPGQEIRLVDAEGRDVPDGTPGEFMVRNTWLAEYYNRPDATGKSLHDGFFSVGDVAYRDDEGYYYICDRKNDMIISGGMNIYPAEIEAALEQHPAIYDVAVFGIPSEEWGEIVHATVVVAPGASLTPDEIKAFGKEHLASYKIPRSVDFVGELPRTGSGKILKRQLRAPYWAGRTAQVS